TSTFPAEFGIAEGDRWLFWFKDLPTAMTGGCHEFRHEDNESQARRDANDPGACGRNYVHRNGYEWRLSMCHLFDEPNEKVEKPASPSLKLGPFDFFPLRLEYVRLTADGEVEELRVLGRLQLPQWQGGSSPLGNDELVDHDSAVIISFRHGAFAGV